MGVVGGKKTNVDKSLAAGAGQVHTEGPVPHFHVNLNRGG